MGAKYRYEFQVGDETLLLAVGESKLTSEGVNVCVKKYSKPKVNEYGGEMETLWVTFDGGVWHNYERGTRTKGGRYIDSFKRLAV